MWLFGKRKYFYFIIKVICFLICFLYGEIKKKRLFKFIIFCVNFFLLLDNFNDLYFKYINGSC